jgi:hypothetical protein
LIADDNRILLPRLAEFEHPFGWSVDRCHYEDLYSGRPMIEAGVGNGPLRRFSDGG